MIMKLLQQTAAKQDAVLECWKGFSLEERTPFMNEILKQCRRASQVREEKMGETMTREDKEFQKATLAELKKKFVGMKTAEDAELFGNLLSMGRSKTNVKSSHRTYTLLFPVFQAVQETMNETFAESDEEEEQQPQMSNKKLKQKKKQQEDVSDTDRFETIVSSFALISSLTLSKKKLTFGCDGPECQKKESEIGQFKKCAKCKKVRYCGRECQVAAWKTGGHKEVCGKPVVTTKAAAQATATATTPATASKAEQQAAQQDNQEVQIAA